MYGMDPVPRDQACLSANEYTWLSTTTTPDTFAYPWHVGSGRVSWDYVGHGTLALRKEPRAPGSAVRALLLLLLAHYPEMAYLQPGLDELRVGTTPTDHPFTFRVTSASTTGLGATLTVLSTPTHETPMAHVESLREAA
ncbi:unnamed protein product [Phytophthora fragariaefolia]|uniref:Unnamed protein product n=1 Tax=Phytophthora fragariaefolia TaxID=1490495 RepID=A0A9W6YHP0_9STRA|nr:unnamed protein product [Phytophthora fragariaefolia]